MSTHPNRRRAWLALVVTLAGGVLVFWWLRASSSVEEEEIQDVTFGVGAIPEGPGRSGGADGEGAGRSPDMGPGAREVPESVSGLDVYLHESVYPPSSRPLTYESHSDLIEWNRRAEYARPTEGDPEVTFIYSADRYFVIGEGQPVTSYLDVRRGGQPVRARVVRATAQVRADRGPELSRPPPTIELDYEWNGERLEHVLDPGAFGSRIDRTVRIRMDIEFDYDGSSTQRDHINFTYTPSSAQPARFTGQFREAIEGGSLVIYAGVEVFQAGWYAIDCNLWDAADQPVAWNRFTGNLDTTATEVPLRFFGKVLHDSGSSAPWHIGELRGARIVEEISPGEQMMVPFEGTYTTQEYAADDFSEAPYEDPRRELITKVLQEEAASGMGISTPAQSLETHSEPALRQPSAEQ